MNARAGALEGRVAVIIGGGSGIGRAATLALAHNGARLVIGNRSEDAGEETVPQITEGGGEAVFQKTDVSEEEEDVQALVKRATGEFGRLEDMALTTLASPGRWLHSEIRAPTTWTSPLPSTFGASFCA